jgi:uncharacterized membrane protein
MKKIEVFDEDNSIIVDDQYDHTTIDFYPDEKKFDLSSSVKNDVFYNNAKYEYKISTNPLEVYIRLLERSSEPPMEYSVKDGVVLESELKKSRFSQVERIANLKKEIEWNKVELSNWYEVVCFILSKHPEIVSDVEYKKYLRQTEQRIKDGLSKIETFLKEKDDTGLEIIEGEYGKQIQYLDNKKTEKNKDIKDFSKYYEENIEKPLFTKGGSNYCGISEYEFRSSGEVLNYIDDLLNNKKTNSSINENTNKQQEKTFWLGYIWTIIVNLVTIGIAFGIYSQVSGNFEVIVISVLILIYLSIQGFFISYGNTNVNQILYLNSEFQRIRKLLKDTPNKTEMDEMQEAKKKVEKEKVKMLINTIALFILFLIAVCYLLGAL